MAQLDSFTSFEKKRTSFDETEFFIIDTKKQFDAWFNSTTQIKVNKRTDFIFRGMSDARHMLYTSAQRLWIQNDMAEWADKKYLRFIYDMILKSKDYPLIKKVFDIYNYDKNEREFPILSILQHYGAPTPLMDWSYNVNVALFFATENLSPGNGIGDPEDYFSIYSINKSLFRNKFLNIRDREDSVFPSFQTYLNSGDSKRNIGESIFYISDFDEGNSSGSTPLSKIQIVKGKAVTSIYNQNIIPQEGLFIFNPFSTKTIDSIFSTDSTTKASGSIHLKPFSCFNIKKDLADYVRRRIKMKHSITKAFIYPKLYDDAEEIKNRVLNEYAT